MSGLRSGRTATKVSGKSPNVFCTLRSVPCSHARLLYFILFLLFLVFVVCAIHSLVARDFRGSAGHLREKILGQTFLAAAGRGCGRLDSFLIELFPIADTLLIFFSWH